MAFPVVIQSICGKPWKHFLLSSQ